MGHVMKCVSKLKREEILQEQKPPVACHGDWLLEFSGWVRVLRDLKVLFSSGNKQTRRRSESHSAKMAAASEPMDDDLIPSGPLLLSRLEVRVVGVFLSH